jgi:hypothetical protein
MRPCPGRGAADPWGATLERGWQAWSERRRPVKRSAYDVPQLRAALAPTALDLLNLERPLLK